MSVCLFVRLSVCSSVCLSVCQPVCPSVCPYPEKRNHFSFVNISPTLVIDTSMERSSRVLQHRNSNFLSKKFEIEFLLSTSGMHRRPFEDRHLVYEAYQQLANENIKKNTSVQNFFIFFIQLSLFFYFEYQKRNLFQNS